MDTAERHPCPAIEVEENHEVMENILSLAAEQPGGREFVLTWSVKRIV